MRTRVPASIAAATLAACWVISDLGPKPAYGGESVFEKMGDGWRKGKWVPGIPDVKPQSIQEVIFPVCWGSPQDCRDKANKDNTSGTPIVFVSYKVACRDTATGEDRGYALLSAAASKREAAVAKIEEALQSGDACQRGGYVDRVSVPGSGQWL